MGQLRRPCSLSADGICFLQQSRSRLVTLIGAIGGEQPGGENRRVSGGYSFLPAGHVRLVDDCLGGLVIDPKLEKHAPNQARHVHGRPAQPRGHVDSNGRLRMFFNRLHGN